MTPLRDRDYCVQIGGHIARVRVRSGVIVDCAAILLRRWRGRPFDELRQTAVEVIDITDEEHAA